MRHKPISRNVTVESRPGFLNPARQGQALIEFVLVLPLLLFLVLFLIQCAVAVYAQAVVTGAAKEGARVAAEYGNSLSAGVQAAERQVQLGLSEKIEVEVSASQPGPDGQRVAVEVKATVPTFVPFLDRAIKFNFSSRSDMLKEGWRS